MSAFDLDPQAIARTANALIEDQLRAVNGVFLLARAGLLITRAALRSRRRRRAM